MMSHLLFLGTVSIMRGVHGVHDLENGNVELYPRTVVKSYLVLPTLVGHFW